MRVWHQYWKMSTVVLNIFTPTHSTLWSPCLLFRLTGVRRTLLPSCYLSCHRWRLCVRQRHRIEEHLWGYVWGWILSPEALRLRMGQHGQQRYVHNDLRPGRTCMRLCTDCCAVMIDHLSLVDLWRPWHCHLPFVNPPTRRQSLGALPDWKVGLFLFATYKLQTVQYIYIYIWVMHFYLFSLNQCYYWRYETIAEIGSYFHLSG